MAAAKESFKMSVVEAPRILTGAHLEQIKSGTAGGLQIARFPDLPGTYRALSPPLHSVVLCWQAVLTVLAVLSVLSGLFVSFCTVSAGLIH